MKISKPFANLAVIVISLLLSLYFSSLVSFFLIIGQYYFHEIGHVLFGYLSNLTALHLPQGAYFVAWKQIGLFSVPTRTVLISAKDNVFFAFGGPIFTILYTTLIAFILNKLGKAHRFRNLIRYGCFLIIAVYAYFAIVGNVLFGTDNWQVNGLPVLNAGEYPFLINLMDLYVYPIFAILTGIITLIIYGFVKKTYIKLFSINL